MVILTLNCGSSSAKYQVYDWDNKDVLATGIVERVTQDGSVITHKPKGKDKFVLESPCPTHKEAIELILNAITDKEHGVISDMNVIGAVGHRVLHGGDKFTKSVKVTPEVLDGFRSVIGLGPLHMPANIMGIEAAQKVLPNVPHAAVMDTAWHQTMPESSFMYAIPREWYEKYAARRYGFHGTSHRFVTQRVCEMLDATPEGKRIICCHIGNGASISAVRDGKSIDTTMGLTPTEGLMMGTRSGDVDPGALLFLMEKYNLSPKDMLNIINKKSGVLGITGLSSDMRDVVDAAEKDNNERAQLALDMYELRILKTIGAYAAELNGVDIIAFTGGVGENQFQTRKRVCRQLSFLGVKIDEELNDTLWRGKEGEISTPDSKVKVVVVLTDEEYMIAHDTEAIIEGREP